MCCDTSLLSSWVPFGGGCSRRMGKLPFSTLVCRFEIFSEVSILSPLFLVRFRFVAVLGLSSWGDSSDHFVVSYLLASTYFLPSLCFQKRN